MSCGRTVDVLESHRQAVRVVQNEPARWPDEVPAASRYAQDQCVIRYERTLLFRTKGPG